MKNLAIAALLVVATASPAMAGTVNILASPYQSGSGGEFTFQSGTAGFLNPVNYAAGVTRDVTSAGSFQTFCIETDEYISIPSNGYNGTLNTAAVAGGTNNGPSPDPVSVGTGWLYSQFARGTLASYNYGAGRTTSAGLLQQAIWWLEQESGYNYDATNVFMLAAYNQFGMSEASARADGAQNYGVMALNMTRLENGVVVKKQDALFYVPDGGTTLMLLGGALMGLGALRRKFAI